MTMMPSLQVGFLSRPDVHLISVNVQMERVYH